MRVITLGDLCDIVSGGTPARSNPEFWNGGTIPWIKIGNIKQKYVNEADEFITQAGLDGSSAKMLRKGTLLYTIFATLGDVGILNIDACTNQAIAGITIKDTKTVLPEYLYYYLHSKKKYVNDIGRGVAQNNINMTILRSFKVPLPELSEQKTIVELLDRVAQIINARQQQVAALDDLIKARFVEMFGDPELNPMEWPAETLGDVLSVEPQNGLYKPQSDYVQDGTGIPILRIDAFYDGKVTDFSGLKRLKCTDIERSRYLLMENDVVINRVNSLEYLGKCAWITGLIEPTVFESNMMRFHVDESRIDPCYMTRLLCSTFIYKQILNRAKKAVNQASINQGDVQSFKILVPPVGLQKKYADFVAQVDKSKAVVQKALDEAQLLFDSLMQKYFG